MKKIYGEIVATMAFVGGCTVFLYQKLAGFNFFWDAQTVWSVVLIIGWFLVSIGYYHQGWMVHTAKNAGSVSLALPAIVFIVQCVLFVKGIYYHDWSLILGAVIVNSGVTFNMYQIARVRYFKNEVQH